MVKGIADLNDGIVGFHVSGVVSKEDYIQILEPAIEKALQNHEDINVLYVIDEDFDHYSWQAMLEDTKIGLSHPLNWHKIAIVTDVEWMTNAVKYLSPLMPFKVRTYSSTQREEAEVWLAEETHHLTFALDKDKQILILEPTGALLKADFERLSSVVESYFEEGNVLRGLMIKTRKFPGWDSISAMKRHLKFIKNHHKKIEKLAFVTESSLLEVLTSFAEMFVHPEVKEFNYKETEEALKWLEN